LLQITQSILDSTDVELLAVLVWEENRARGGNQPDLLGDHMTIQFNYLRTRFW